MLSLFSAIGRFAVVCCAGRCGRRVLVSAVAVAGPTLWILEGPVGSHAARAEPASTDHVPAIELYQRYCQRCHGADGKGVRRRGPDGLPDFTRGDWQKQRSDAQLTVSIRDGKGTDMPAYSDRLSAKQVAEQVARVRAFVPSDVRVTSAREGQLRDAEAASSVFETEFRKLKDEYEELRREFRELSD
jgi:mono/diheme cytochrome c family protein